MITVKNNYHDGNLIMYFILSKAFPDFSPIDLPLLYMVTRGHAVAQAVIGE